MSDEEQKGKDLTKTVTITDNSGYLQVLPTINSYNNKIACKPPESLSMKVEVKSGFAAIKQKRELLELEVLYSFVSHPHCFNVGDKIYVRGESIKIPWMKEIYELEENSFVLVPLDAVVLKKTPTYGYSSPYITVTGSSGGAE